MSDTITCPSCGEPITISEALSKQLNEEAEKKYKQQLAIMNKQTQQKLEEIKKKEEELQREHEKIEEEVTKKLKANEEKIKKELWDKAQQAAKDKSNLELKDLKQQLEEKQKQQEDFEKRELEMRKEKRELEEQQRKQKLELERQLDEQRKAIQEKIEKEQQEQHRLKMMEKDKQLNDLMKKLDEAQRKASQGSQQNQGEVLELDLEQTLTDTFKYDQINPVGKGVSGADIVQTVKSVTGATSGVILWEIKQTKNWTEKWVAKFKDDLRAQKANIPVLVTTVLPKDMQDFGMYEGIWVTKPNYAIQLAAALRKGLIDVAYERAASAGKGSKQELLYNYVASHEFRQRVEAIVEIYQEMQTQINKERTAFERSWKQREMQMQRLITSTAGMYGEMQGLVGASMPQIKGLELESDPNQLESGDEMTLF